MIISFYHAFLAISLLTEPSLEPLNCGLNAVMGHTAHTNIHTHAHKETHIHTFTQTHRSMTSSEKERKLKTLLILILYRIKMHQKFPNYNINTIFVSITKIS